MPTIHLTNNTTLDLTGSAAGSDATINRYLSNPLSFTTPAALNSIGEKTIADVDPATFPIAASATGEGKFAVAGTSLDVKLGASASVGLLSGGDAAEFFHKIQSTKDPAVASLVSFGLKGTLSAGDVAKVGDFCLGITESATVALTTFCPAAASDAFVDAVRRAIAGLTIPHDVNDLRSLPENIICQIDAASSLKFTASVTYQILNDPLATTSIANLPAIAVSATAGATIEGTVTHTSDHTVTIAKLPSGLIHLSVNLMRTDDFETSLTVSAGATAKIGDQDALAFLVGKFSPDASAELKKIQAEIPAGQAQQLSTGIKAAVDAALSSSLEASLKAALDDSRSNSRVFLYEIDLAALGGDSTAALQSALAGDFTTITKSGAKLAGIRELDSALTVTAGMKNGLTLHLLGIFNWGSTSAFVEKSKVDYTKDTHEIVLSDEAIEIVGDNLDSEKLREVVVKGITLTLPASANTPEAATPINMVFFDRQAPTSPSTMRQFVNVLRATGSPSAAGATSLLAQNLKTYGTSSLYLGLNLTPQQCRQLLIDAAGQPYDWTTYLGYACDAQATILEADDANRDRWRLFAAGLQFWKTLEKAGSAPNRTRLLSDRGIRPNAIVDVVALIWWSQAMEKYAQALAAGKSVVDAAKDVVKDGTGGFNEPWLVLAAWNMLRNPALESLFTSSLMKHANGAAV